MNAQNLGFMSSWRMLTRDKGWLKPVLILTLIGWIPVLGQIVMLGYALEWARLTAWGVDAAPKQRGIDYGKVLSTGGRAFLVNLSLGFVIALVLQILFPGSLAWIMSNAFGSGAMGMTSAFALVTGTTLSIVTIVAAAFVGLFLQAASLRATLYDSFTAGWRLDRLFQMIARDFGGFCKTWLVTFIGGVIQGAYTFVVALIGAVVVMGGVVGALAAVSVSGNYMTAEHFLLEQLLRMGAGPLLLFVLLAIALSFVGGVITTAMSLVAINAMGQWFCRFDVDRWGVSSDPLPQGVPHRQGDWGAAGQTPPAAPVPPAGQREGDAAGAGDAAEAFGAAPSRPEGAGAEGVTPVSGAPFGVRPDPVVPLDAEPSSAMPLEADSASVESADEGGAPADASSAAGPSEVSAASPAPVEPLDAVSSPMEARESSVDEVAPLDEAPADVAPEKKPIPLGPITETDEGPFRPIDDDGPIKA